MTCYFSYPNKLSYLHIYSYVRSCKCIEYICIGFRQQIGEVDENGNLVVSSQVIPVFTGKLSQHIQQ